MLMVNIKRIDASSPAGFGGLELSGLGELGGQGGQGGLNGM
jgi:hypothetical protein